jgi:hypothetical protein
MSSRLVPVLLLSAMLYALGAGVASLPYQSSNANAAHDTVPGDADIPTLPTITVRPDRDAVSALMPTVTLPAVTVRPGPAEIAAARALDVRVAGSGAVVAAVHALSGGMAPGSGLDMPYYSFGKSVYRLRKE